MHCIDIHIPHLSTKYHKFNPSICHNFSTLAPCIVSSSSSLSISLPITTMTTIFNCERAQNDANSHRQTLLLVISLSLIFVISMKTHPGTIRHHPSVPHERHCYASP